MIRSILLTVLVPLHLVTGPVAAAQRPHGDWVLDEARSDSTPRPLGPGRLEHSDPGPAAEPGGGPPGNIGGGVPGEGMGRGRMMGRQRNLDPRQLARMRQTVDLTRWTPTRISLAGDTTVSLTDAAGSQVTFRIDGRSVGQPVDSGGEVETRVRWVEDALVIERKVDGGGRESETCEVGLGGTRLLVYVAVDGLPTPIAFTRTYRRAEQSAR